METDSLTQNNAPKGDGAAPNGALLDAVKDMEINDAAKSNENEATAEKLKDEANKHFANNEFNLAVELYTKAIELNGSSKKAAIYYANRAFAHLKTECFGYALADANEAIRLDSTYMKAYYRRASANMALNKYKLALQDFELVTKMRPKDADAKRKFDECAKIVRQHAFLKALSNGEDQEEQKRSLIMTMSEIAKMDLESNYTGPRFDFESVEDAAADETGAKTTTTRPKLTAAFMTELMAHFREQRKLPAKFALALIIGAYELLKAEPSLVRVPLASPSQKFTICGDVHGQFYDLLNIFNLNGPPSEANPYLFNGDFVDRGSFSVEVILTLFGFKVLYPRSLFLARGNHESVNMNTMYGFEGEVKAKYDAQMSALFSEVFKHLPLSHLITSYRPEGATESTGQAVLAMHGGLFSEDGVTLADIQRTERVREPPENGLMCDILWSDPQTPIGRAPSKRGVGIQFGPDVTRRFCDLNKISYIVRSHEVKEEGYEVTHDGRCITVFSAPNYCDTMGNKGAFITLRGDDLTPKFTSFSAVPHPSVRAMAYANPLLMFLGGG